MLTSICCKRIAAVLLTAALLQVSPNSLWIPRNPLQERCCGSETRHSRTDHARRRPTGAFVWAASDANSRNSQPRNRRERSTSASVPAARNAILQQLDPLERQLDSLRQQLSQTRATIAALRDRPTADPRRHSRSSSSGSNSHSSNLHGAVDDRDGGRRPTSGVQTEELRQLALQEQQLRLEIAVALQRLNMQRPDGGSRLPEAEAHYRAVISSLESLAAPGSALAASPSPGSTTPSAPFPASASWSASPDLLAARLGLLGNLAALLLEAERPQAALKELDRALEEAGDVALAGVVAPGLLCGLRFNRGKALAAVGRMKEAEEGYSEAAVGAVGLEPGCFAKACAAMTRLPDELLQFVQSAVQLAEESGLRQRALSAADPTAGAAPPFGVADSATAVGVGVAAAAAAPHGADMNVKSERKDRTAGASGRLDELASAGGDPFGDRSAGGWLAGIEVSELGWLYFALAKALDDRAAEAREVWRVLKQANALLSSQQPYDPDHDWRQLRTLTAVFTAPLLAAAASAGVGVYDPTPVFVVGLPRSGSTLVETMLSRYPGVWAAGEDTALAPLTGPINDLLAAKGLSQPAALSDIGRRYLEEMRRRAVAGGWDPHRPPVRIVDKMLRNLWLLGYVEMLLPRACIVHVVRHPLDVALSCYSQPFGYSGMPWSWRLRHIGEQIRMSAMLAAHWREHLPEGRVLTLHYEEVVAAPELSARRLLSHCGLDWDPRVVDFHRANRTVATASVAQVRRPLYNTSVGRWRKYEQQLAELVEQIQPEILSYEVELAAALHLTEAEARRLQQQQQQRSEARGHEGDHSTESKVSVVSEQSKWNPHQEL